MPQPDIIDSIRSAPPRPPRNGGGVLHLLIGGLAIAAIGALGYFGVGWWLGQSGGTRGGPTGNPVVIAASLGSADLWTDRDNDVCKQRGRAAARRPMPADLALANRTVTQGFANMATVLACQIGTKEARFCDEAEKAKLVAAVNDYLTRMDAIIFLLNLEGAPMKFAGEAFGGEAAFGASVHEMYREGTIGFMRQYHATVAGSLKSLARDGVITAEDFGFMGMGVPARVKEMLDGVKVTRAACA